MIQILALTLDASACGGFFCDTVQPVEQAGEGIVFGVEDGMVTTHVEISYTGPGSDFAWILPIPGVPDVFLSSPKLFDVLAARTGTVTNLAVIDDGGCSGDVDDSDSDTDADSDSDTDSDTDTDAEIVDVLAEAPVGPYETVVLQATDAGALVDWLQENGFGVPDTMTGAIGPYLANGMNFLALKLQKDATVGELAPLGVRWAGERPSIPLTLTSVAATPNMGLTVYVVGEHRAVPLSHHHFQLNPLAYDWLGNGLDPAARLGLAANEAGGLAFTTIFARKNAGVDVWFGSNTDGLAELTGKPYAWISGLASRGIDLTPEMVAILRTHLPAPAGVDESLLYQRPQDYPQVWRHLAAEFDAVAATAEVELRIIQPEVAAQEVLDSGPWLTRLDTVVSPDEMVADPIFGFNPDLPAVSNVQQGELHLSCGEIQRMSFPGGYTAWAGERRLSFSDVDAWLGANLDHVAIVVEQLSESGPGTIIADHRQELNDLAIKPLEDPPSAETDGSGWGCATGSPAGAGWIGLAALWLRRRSRS